MTADPDGNGGFFVFFFRFAERAGVFGDKTKQFTYHDIRRHIAGAGRRDGVFGFCQNPGKRKWTEGSPGSAGGSLESRPSFVEQPGNLVVPFHFAPGRLYGATGEGVA